MKPPNPVLVPLETSDGRVEPEATRFPNGVVLELEAIGAPLVTGATLVAGIALVILAASGSRFTGAGGIRLMACWEVLLRAGAVVLISLEVVATEYSETVSSSWSAEA